MRLDAITAALLAAAALCAGGFAVNAMAATERPPVPVAKHGVLTGAHGMTLYTFAKDKAHSRQSACNGVCAKNWPPFIASASRAAEGNYSFVRRAGGQMQWAYKGKPLYYWHLDRKPGDRKGDGFKNVWHVARP